MDVAKSESSTSGQRIQQQRVGTESDKSIAQRVGRKNYGDEGVKGFEQAGAS
ncbi:hypothetical protein F511_39304 [Dorcoceras hygrometricum]|uniref:Uncharacterized protein n=1 Tax=Dorcoceras hygrometricum TaxID=472368 RepID=A0A2Z7DG51_9LAMI|nr:hypothetical protein F511_39304 [Dorcoceras hygrometricum]